MNYYKVIVNGNVIDANFVFLKWQEKHNILVGCDAEEAHFIQSSDQKEVWRAEWLNPVPEGAGEYTIVDAVEITETEYVELRQQLDLGNTVEEPVQPSEDEGGDESSENTEDNNDEEMGETVMTAEEMRRKLVSLEEQLAEQKGRNDFLEECLLEISEVVYV